MTNRTRQIIKRIAATWAEGMVMSDPLVYCAYLEALAAGDDLETSHTPSRIIGTRESAAVATRPTLVPVRELAG